MAVGRPMYGAFLALAMLALGSEGKTILVTDGAASGGSCPGASCTLTAAWGAMELNDTILLNVSANISQRLTKQYSSSDSPDFYSTITIMAVRSGVAVTATETTTFLGVVTGKAKINVVLKGFAISGFTMGNSEEGTLICVDQRSGVCIVNNRVEGTHSGSRSPQAGMAHREHTRQTTEAQRSLWAEKGAVPDPYNAVLTLQDMAISYNTYNTEAGHSSLVHVTCHYDCSVIYDQVSIKSNKVTSYNQYMIGVLHKMDFYFKSTNPLMQLYLADVEVVGNNVSQPEGSNGDASTLFMNWGDIYAKGLQVGGNTMGQGLGVLGTGAKQSDSYHKGDILMEYSTFTSNAVFPASSANTWTLLALHAHLKQVVIESAEPRAVWSKDDQYLSSCTFTTPGGATPLLQGWQFFNRDPYHPLGSTSTTLGFANCTAAAGWFPCPPLAPTCTDLFSPSGSSVGYSCA